MESNNKFIIIFFIFFAIVFLIPILTTFLPIVSTMFVTTFPKIEAWHIGLIALGIILAWLIATYNSFVNLKEKVNQAKSGIDVYLKQRFDLIPNLVETVKGYTKHEKDVLENITKLRLEFEQRDQNDIKQIEELNNRYTKILALVEAYPELKASEQFLNLQKTLSKIESQLQAARRIYNMEVTEYNIKRQKFPSNLVGIIFGFKEISLFEIVDSQRENIDVNI